MSSVLNVTAAAVREFDELPAHAQVRARVLRALLGGISQDTLERRVKAGVLPKPRKHPGGRENFWTVGEVRQALSALEAA